jgi:hypothetical protein
MGLALMLAILSARTRAPASVLEGQMAPPADQQVPTSVLQREQQAPPEGLPPQTEESGSESGEEQQPPPEGGN